MELSKRLRAVANLVSDGFVVADVGTDHGYIPIYLVQENKCKRAIAMDVNQGPLLRAQAHISAYHLAECIETRLSDGVKALQPGEVECVVIAGMGGALAIKIMEDGKEVFRNLREFILQPQSELEKVREYLCQNAYCIVDENMILEDGKFYPMFRVVPKTAPEYHPIELRYGKLLLEQQHAVLKLFLEKEMATKEKILTNLNASVSEQVQTRRNEIQQELEGIKYALQRYYKENRRNIS